LYQAALHVVVNTALLSAIRSVAWGWHAACLDSALTMPRYARYGFDVRARSTAHECAKADIREISQRCRHASRTAAPQRTSRKPRGTGSRRHWTGLMGWRF